MADWINWFVMAGLLVILEIFSGTFYLLMVALGFAAGGLAAWLEVGVAMQAVIAALVGVSATVLLRRSKLGKPGRNDAAHDPNINLDIGQTLTVGQWQVPAEGPATARVQYRGALWDVELAPGLAAEAGMYVIEEIRGSRLIVGKHARH